MNEYLIDPSWFYWISVADSLRILFIFFIVLSCVIMLFSTLFLSEDLIKFENWKKVLIISSIFTLIGASGIIFMPAKETLIEMEVARLATKNNINWTVKSVKGIIDYVIGAIK